MARDRVRWIAGLLVLGLLLGSGSMGVAQGGLNPGGTPGFGELEMAQEFATSPLVVPMTVLGTVDVEQSLKTSCRGLPTGFVAANPDYRVNYEGAGAPLRFFFVGREDAMLMVQHLREGEPVRKGRWFCDDDSGGRQHPMLTFVPAEAGTYNIWVGSYALGETINGSLYVTANTTLTPEDYVQIERAQLPAGNLELQQGLALAAGRGAIHGQATILPLSSENPAPVTLRAGGRAVLSPAQRQACIRQDGEADAANGYFMSQDTPEYSVFVEPRSPDEQLNLFFVSPGGDTTLAVTDGRGNWYCDDDALAVEDTLNPSLTLPVPEKTTFYVWVGTYNPGEFVEGQLYASLTTDLATALGVINNPDFEQQLGDGQGGGSPTDLSQVVPNPSLLDLNAEPYSGIVILGERFEPDPVALRTAVGGEVSMVEALGGLCAGLPNGFLDARPEYGVAYSGNPTDLLRIFFVAADDTVLAVRTPAGAWYCDDNSGGDSDPVVDIPAPQAGIYKIWLGSTLPGNYASGTLYITGQRAVTPASRR